MPQPHPTVPQRPLIHYEMALLLLPAMLGGNSLGVVVGRVFPPTLLVILSLVLLVVAATKTAAKGRSAARQAKAAREATLLRMRWSSSASGTLALPIRALSVSPVGDRSDPMPRRRSSVSEASPQSTGRSESTACQDPWAAPSDCRPRRGLALRARGAQEGVVREPVHPAASGRG